jgi:hypothetical protein
LIGSKRAGQSPVASCLPLSRGVGARYSRTNLSRLANARLRKKRTPIGQSSMIGRIGLFSAYFLDAGSVGGSEG